MMSVLKIAKNLNGPFNKEFDSVAVTWTEQQR